MDNFLYIHKILVSIIDTLAISLGIIVFTKNPKGRVNKIFFILSFLLVGWVTFAYLGRLFAAKSLFLLALYSLKIAWFLTPLFFCGLYLLVLGVGKIKRYRYLSGAIITLGIFTSLLTLFTSLVIRNFFVTDGNIEIIYGKGIIFFLGYGVLLIGVTIFLILEKYYKALPEERVRIQYLALGLFIFYLFNIIFNILLPIFFHKTDLYYLGDYSTIVFLILTGLAIIKRQLFGIKIFLTEVLVSLISILLLLDFLFSRTVFDFVWKGILLFLFLIFGYLLIKSVIREIKYKEQLQRAYERLKKLDKAKSEFISIASHQLRTPLTAIKGYISMILEGDYGPVSDKVKKPLENIYKSNERLIKLVNDLLDLSRIESGRIILEKREASIEDIIESVIEELKVEADKKGIYLRFKKPEEKIEKLFIDPEKIRNVVMNVIDNSIRYTQKGGVSISLEKPRVNWLRIVISDTGAGMTKEEISKIFQSFSRAAAGTKLYTEGAGLGLYIARRFVELHGGKIWAESKGRGKGSTFYIEIPMK